MQRKKHRRIGLGVLLCVLLAGTIISSAQEESEEKIKIRLMHYWGDTDTDISARYLKEILDNEFEEAFPNVELIQEISDNATYKSKIRVLMAADEEPDIMMGYGGGFSEVFVEAGKILALDDYLSDFYKEHMDMEMQENYIYDGKQYGICYAYWTGVLYCNRELFEQAGAKIPETYEELIESCCQLKEAGIEPIACGMLDQWQGQQWVNNFTIQLGGAELYKAMAKGEASYENEAFIEAVHLTSGLIDEGVFCSDMYRLTSSEAEELFLNGETAMIYIGSWYTTSAETRLGDKLEVVRMPVIPGAQYPEDYHGGASNGWMVSADTQYPELASEIAAWLGYRLSCYQPDQAAFVIEEKDVMTEISDTQEKIMELYANKAGGGVAWDTLMTPDMSSTWLDLCSRLFKGRIDGKGFAKVMENRRK